MKPLVKPTTKNSPAIHRPKDVHNGNADEYAPPHTMDGKRISPKTDSFVTVDPNTLKATDVKRLSGTMRVSMGDPGANDVKTDGIKMRGAGAAERGFMSRGPMA
jgi:hypothetical protein